MNDEQQDPEFEKWYNEQQEMLFPPQMDPEMRETLIQTFKQQYDLIPCSQCIELLSSEDILQIAKGLSILFRVRVSLNSFSQPDLYTNLRKISVLLIDILENSQIPHFKLIAIFNFKKMAFFFPEFEIISNQNGFLEALINLFSSPNPCIFEVILRLFLKVYHLINKERINQIKRKVGHSYFKILPKLYDKWPVLSFLFYFLRNEMQDPLKLELKQQMKEYISDIFNQDCEIKIMRNKDIFLSYELFELDQFIDSKIVIKKVCELVENQNIESQLHEILLKLVYEMAKNSNFCSEILNQKYFDRINFNLKNQQFAQNDIKQTLIVQTIQQVMVNNQVQLLLTKNRKFILQSPILSMYFQNKEYNLASVCSFSQIFKSVLLSKNQKAIRDCLLIIDALFCSEIQNWEEGQKIIDEFNQQNLEQILVSLNSTSNRNIQYQHLIYRILNVLQDYEKK